jgi:hypothetical protein
MYHLIDYVWCVENFSQYLEPNQQEVYPLLTSPVFSYKNTSWVLNLYPEGLGDSASQGYISLFIKYVSEDPETINAKVELSLLNNKNERVYCRDTGDHQYQTFIDFGYKQFLKIQDIRDQRDELIINSGKSLKIFARVEFENSSLPSSLTWSNYDLLLFKENMKELYENKNLSDIVIKVVKKTNINNNNINNTNEQCINNINNNLSNNYNNINHLRPLYHPYLNSNRTSNNKNYKSKSTPFNTSHLTKSTGPTLSILQSNCLCLNNNNNNIDSNFSKYNLFEYTNHDNDEETTSDDNEILEIKSHKFILASRSGKFRDLLRTNLIKINSKLSSNSSRLHNSKNCSCRNKNSMNNFSSKKLNCQSSICNNKLIDQNDLNNEKFNENENNSLNQSINHDCDLIDSNLDGLNDSSHCLSPNCIKKLDLNSLNSFSSNPSSSTSASASSDPSSGFYDEYSTSPCSCASSVSSPNGSKTTSGEQLVKDDCDINSETSFSSSLSSSSSPSSLSLPTTSFISSSSSNTSNNLNDSKTMNINNNNHEHCQYCENNLDYDEDESSNNNSYLNSKNHNLLTINNDSDIQDLLIIETDRSPKVIEYLIKYMYTCYLDTLDQYAKDIYEISKEYKVHGLTNLAREYIIKDLNIQNCCDYLVFSVINNDYELNNKIQTFITENYETITKTNAYKQAKRKYRELFENTFNELLSKKSLTS